MKTRTFEGNLTPKWEMCFIFPHTSRKSKYIKGKVSNKIANGRKILIKHLIKGWTTLELAKLGFSLLGFSSVWHSLVFRMNLHYTEKRNTNQSPIYHFVTFTKWNPLAQISRVSFSATLLPCLPLHSMYLILKEFLVGVLPPKWIKIQFHFLILLHNLLLFYKI